MVQLEHLLGDIVFCRTNRLELLPLIEKVRVAPKGEFEPAHARPLHAANDLPARRPLGFEVDVGTEERGCFPKVRDFLRGQDIRIVSRCGLQLRPTTVQTVLTNAGLNQIAKRKEAEHIVLRLSLLLCCWVGFGCALRAYRPHRNF